MGFKTGLLVCRRAPIRWLQVGNNEEAQWIIYWRWLRL